MRYLVVIGIVVALAAGCSGRAGRTNSAPDGDSAAELEALYRARTDSARMRFTPGDVRFINGMIAHHAQALVMAHLVPARGASSAVQTLAARIINAQQDEIALMQQWLRERGQPVPEVHVMPGQLLVHGLDHAMHMPGMLTDAQLKELEQARGVEFERLFLTYMIQHHRGAVTMVHELFATRGAAQDEAVFKLASDVQADQNSEITRMELMLKALPAKRSNDDTLQTDKGMHV